MKIKNTQQTVAPERENFIIIMFKKKIWPGVCQQVGFLGQGDHVPVKLI